MSDQDAPQTPPPSTRRLLTVAGIRIEATGSPEEIGRVLVDVGECLLTAVRHAPETTERS